MNLALFDLDNTLLAGDSDYEWAQFLIDRGVLDRDVYEARNRGFYEQYKAGTLDIHEFLGFALEPLARHTPQELEVWHDEFMAERIRPMIGQAARDLVARHADARRPARHRHRDQRFRHRAHRARVRRAAPDRHRARDGRRPLHRPGAGARRASATARSRRLDEWLAARGQTLGKLRRHVVLQRFAQRPAAARAVRHPVAVDPDHASPRVAARARLAGAQPAVTRRPQVRPAFLYDSAAFFRAFQPLHFARFLIKKFIRRVLGRSREPKTYAFETHQISRDQISYGARKVCEALQGDGYTAFVVGGAVRDLLLGVQPKDFDVATDAHARGGAPPLPPLAHHRPALPARARDVRRRDGRGLDLPRRRDADEADEDEHGRVLRDNVFGTQRTRTRARRDFTVNALYYDPATEDGARLPRRRRRPRRSARCA